MAMDFTLDGGGEEHTWWLNTAEHETSQNFPSSYSYPNIIQSSVCDPQLFGSPINKVDTTNRCEAFKEDMSLNYV